MADASPGIFTALARRARDTPDARLVTLEALGLGITLAVFFWQPRWMAYVLPFLALAMFGIWGVAEHFRRELYFGARDGTGALSVFQLIAALIGTVAVAVTLYAVVGRAIGTIVS